MPSAVRYNKGDFVFVKVDIQESEYYRDYYVAERMAALAGHIVQITEALGNDLYTVAETDAYEYIWPGEMFAGLAIQTQYVPGDMVLVREDLCPDESYRMFSSNLIVDIATEEMVRLAGSVVIIREITESGKYLIEGSTLNWTDEMFSGYAGDEDIEPSTDGDMMRLFGILEP